MGLYEEIMAERKQQRKGEFNYETQKKTVKKAEKKYAKALNEEYQKQNVFNLPQRQNNILLPTTKEQRQQNNNFFENNMSIVNKNKLKKAQTNVKQLKDVLDEEQNKFKYARYLHDVDTVDNEKTSLYDKTLGVIERGLRDLGSTIATDKYKYKDENGNTIYLPNRAEIKQQKVRQDYDTGIGRFLGDVGYNTSKIVGSTALNTIAPGAGSTLYWTDMAGDNYKNTINQGYSADRAAAYSLVNTGLEYLTGKALGGATGKLTGGSARELDNALSNVMFKVSKNPTLSRILGTGGSEFVEEFSQEYFDNISRMLILGEDIDLSDKKILEDALYSGLVGFASGGAVESMNGSDATRNIKMFETFKEQIEERKSNTSNEDEKAHYDSIISNIDKYLEKPFSIDEKAIENTQQQIANLPTIENTNTTDTTANALQNLETFKENQRTIQAQQLEEESNKKIAAMEKELEELKKKMPEVNTEGMNLQESANQYGINGNSPRLTNIQTMFENRGINARFDATIPQFKDNSIAALWSKDPDGNRNVIINPNAPEDTIIENLAIHELTHDIMSSVDRNDTLKATEIIDYVKTLEGYAEARRNLEETYADQYNPNNANFQSLIDEEVVADVLGRKLGNQEFINRLVNQKPNIAQRIYDWIKNKIVNRGGKIRDEDLFWRNVANRFEKAYKMKYNNSTNEASTRYKATPKNNPNGHVKEFLKLTGKQQQEAHRVISPVASRLAGIEEAYSATDINGTTFKFEIFEDGNYRVFEVIKLRNNSKEVANETNPSENSQYSMANTKQQRNNSSNNNRSNRNNGTSQQDVKIPTREQIKSQNRIPNQTQQRNNRELDSSFSNVQGLESYTTTEIKDLTRNYAEDILRENGYDGIDIKDIEIHGSRKRGTAKTNSDLDVVIQYDGDIREDDFFNMLNDNGDDNLYIDGIRVDINPIQEDMSSYMERSNQYDKEVLSSKDSDGRELTKQQQEFFKDSKARDSQGRLITLYHGTPNDFTVFNTKNFGGANGTAEGFGIYLTDNIEVADDYLQQDKGKVMKLYANITKPAATDNLTIKKQDIIKAIKELTNKEAQQMVNDGDYDNINDAIKDTWISNYTYTYDKSIEDSYNDVAKTILESSENDYEILQELMNGSGNNDYKNVNDFYKTITDTLGFDGIKTKWDFSADSELKKKNADIWLAFYPNQVKNVDNKNPSSNDDIRYSKENTEWGKWVNKNIKNEGTITKLGDIKLPTKETTKKELNLPKNLASKKVEQKVNQQGLEAIKKAANAGKSYLQLKYNEVKTLKNELKEYLGLSKEELTNAKTYNGIKEKVKQFINRQAEYLDEDLKRVKNEIRNTNIKVDSELKEQITDYNDFKKSNFGKLKLSTTGQSIDSIYQELSDQYPYYFDSNITSEADMLYELSDFMNRSNTITEEYKLSDEDVNKAVDKIFNSLIDNSLSNEDINDIQEEIMNKYSKRTRKVVQEELQQEMGITLDDIAVGKDINALGYQRTDPIRLNEKVFGTKVGQKINDATINKTKHNEAERTRFLNKEREEIKNLGIKARSKESAAVQKYGEKQYINDNGEISKYGDRELASEFPDVKTQEKIKHAAQVLRNKYDNYIEQINNVITELGYDPIPKRPDYMRHFQEINDKLSQWGIPLNPTDLSKDALPTDINGLTDQFKPGKNWFASAMQRKGFKTTYDAITGIDGYLEGASNLIYHTPDIQRYRALSKMIRDTYGQTHGMDNIDPSTEEGQKRLNDIFDNKLSKYAAWLDEQANALAGKKGGIDRAAERLLGRKIYSVLDAAKKQVGSNMTGFNVRSAMTNFASAVQGAAKTKKLAFVKGTMSTIKNIIHKDNLIDKSDFLTSRFGSDQLSKKAWQKASNAGQIFMTGTDYFTANQIWRSKYYENLDKGMSESQAIKKADDFAARIMGDRSKGSTAEAFNSKTLGLLTQFQLEVNNQWSSIIHDNKIDIKSGNKSGATVMFQLGQLAALSYLFNNFMKSMTGSDVMIDPIDMLKKIIGDGDDDDEETIEDRAKKVMGDLVDDLPFVSFMTGGRIPMKEAFKGAESLAGYYTGATDSYGNPIKWSDVKKDLAESAFYWLLPTGYGQVKKTKKGLSMYDKNLPIPGSYTDSGNLRFNADTSTGGKVKAALFGQYSSEESQKYIESGYKSIRKERLEEMKELDMKASEYRKYREDLNKAGTKNSEKIDYIANSDYSDEAKDIMAKNVLGRDFDINEYEKYDSYEEYDYAQKYPEKYSVIKYIAPYDKYNTYKDKIKNIRDNTTNDKAETIKYINGLNMSIPQKAMFIKQYYKSFKSYDKQIIEYINSQKLTRNEKEEILTQLGFTIRNGRVY